MTRQGTQEVTTAVVACTGPEQHWVNEDIVTNKGRKGALMEPHPTRRANDWEELLEKKSLSSVILP